MLALTDREKVAHLLRRFGLGAVPEEVDALVKFGPEGAFNYLLNYDKVDEGFPISPWEVCWEEDTSDIYLDSFRPAGLWSLRLLMTQRPLQEKLTLFWHNHFAVSGNKVEIGPMMSHYLEVMRTHGLGKFDDLLTAVSASPAMSVWLDMGQNQKGSPNENFAREVMELFTLGIGNYTEKDVQEVARAFTGWGVRLLILEYGAENYLQTAKSLALANRPLFAFAFSPELHDDGPKTIFGKTKNWTGQDVLSELTGRSETANYLAKKLWSFFAYENPEPAVVSRLAKAYFDSGHSIKAMLVAIFSSPEFWSEKCVLQQIKSPVDFVYSLGRQLGIGPYLRTLHPKEPTPAKQLAKPLRDIGGVMFGLTFQQGMMLLFPPDVAGWKWGTAWITSEAMAKRTSLGPLLMGADSKDYGAAEALRIRVVSQGKNSSSEEIVTNFMNVFDAILPKEKKALLVKVCDASDGPSCLASAKQAAPVFAEMCKLLFASPEFQFC